MRTAIYIVIFFATVIIIGCEDFFEQDLSEKSVTLVAPSNGVITDISVQTFWWEELDGAFEYQLQVVSTGFDSIVQLVLDTTITGTQFQQSLYPGAFQWRVRALNGSSMSPFTTYSLTVDSTTSLTSQTILLSSPATGSYTNDLSVPFAWQALSSATFYRFQVSDDAFVSGANVLDTTVTTESVEITFASDVPYYWRVRGETETSVSTYSSIWQVDVDTTAPGSVTLWLPEHNAVFQSQTFDFAWQSITDDGAPTIDSLYLYSDSLVTVYDRYEGVQGSVTDSVAIGTYFWRVRTYDEAGNVGGYSAARKFTVF
jgi:hypothetical protein